MSSSSSHNSTTETKGVARRHAREDRRRNFSRPKMRNLIFMTTKARYIASAAIPEVADFYIVRAMNLVKRSVDACHEGKTLKVEHAQIAYNSLHQGGGFYSSAPVKIRHRGGKGEGGEPKKSIKTKKTTKPEEKDATRRPSSEVKETPQKRVSKEVRREDEEGSQPPPAKKVAVSHEDMAAPVAKPAATSTRKRAVKQTAATEAEEGEQAEPESKADAPKAGRKRKPTPSRVPEDEESTPPTKRSSQSARDDEDGDASQASSSAPDILTLRDDIR